MSDQHKSSLTALGAVVCALAWGSASGHHPIQGKFDASASVTLEGVVTKVDWRNPHAHIFMNVRAAGEVDNWAIELDSPVELRAAGWARDTIVPGEAIVVRGSAARDGSRQVWAESLTRADGRELLQHGPAPVARPLAPRPVPRWPDGQVALGAVPNGGASGYWAHPSATALVEDGVNVRMDAYGQLANPADARRVAPLQPWALALYRYRQARHQQDDPTYINCKPPGGPRQFQSDLGFKLVEDRARQRLFVLLGSGNSNYRIIYLDGREAVGQVGGDDDNPLYYGRAVGHWEGDTLVVETTGFNEDFWFTYGGLPHTNLLRLTERFTRTDFDTLHYEVTIDDRGAYTRPWKANWNLQWVGGAELPMHLCQENRP